MQKKKKRTEKLQPSKHQSSRRNLCKATQINFRIIIQDAVCYRHTVIQLIRKTIMKIGFNPSDKNQKRHSIKTKKMHVHVNEPIGTVHELSYIRRPKLLQEVFLNFLRTSDKTDSCAQCHHILCQPSSFLDNGLCQGRNRPYL